MNTEHGTRNTTLILLCLIYSLTCNSSFAQNVGISTTGAPSNTSAMLDLNTGSNYTSPNGKGLLIPNVFLANTTDAVTIGLPATSLLVYNTNAALSDGKGFYYNAGTSVSPSWVRFMSGTPSTDWKLTGNAGTTAGTNFLGTTDAQDLVFKTNGVENMRVLNANGYVGIGIAVPLANLHVVGSAFVTQPGNLQWGKLSNGGLTLYRDMTGTFTNDNGFIDFKYLSTHQNDVRIRYNHSLGTNGALEFLSNTDGISANSTSKMVILNSNGNVGIGTTTPNQKLDVRGVIKSEAAQPILEFYDADAPVDNKWWDFWNPSNGTLRIQALSDAGSGGGQVLDLVRTGNQISALRFGDRFSNNPSIYAQGIISGNVGIGTDAPGEQFTIGVNNFVFHNGGDKAIGFNTDWTVANNWTKIAGSAYQGRIHFNPTTGDLGFISSSVATGLGNLADNKIFIEGGTGVVGIGTVTPSAQLTVVATSNTTSTQMLNIMRNGTGAAGNGLFYIHGATVNDYNAITGTGDVGMFFDIDGNPAISSSTKGLVIAPWANGGTPGSGTGIKIQENGNVGIGTTTPTALLSVNGAANNTTGVWALFSDARIKTIDADFTDGLAVIKQIHPVKFHYNKNAPFNSNKQQIGIIAQELEKIAPYMVDTMNYKDINDLREVNSQAYIFLLINAIKEQQQLIESLKGMVQNQETEVASLKVKNKVIMNKMKDIKANQTITEARFRTLEEFLKTSQK